MSVIGDMIDDVAFRIGEPRKEEPYTHAVILRAMKRVYQRINREIPTIQRSWSIDFSDLGANDSLADGYVALPSDIIKPFNIDPFRKFVPPDVWSDESSYKFTIKLSRMYFTGVTSSTTFTVLYLSFGYTLTDSESPGSTEVNEPEWPDDLQQLLLYETAMELKANYPLRNDDFRNARGLRQQLLGVRLNVQEIVPETVGPDMYDRMVEDPYE